MTRIVSPWTPPAFLEPGDRAHNLGFLAVEWDGRRGIPVCDVDDLALTEWTGTGEQCCPICGRTARQMSMPASATFGCAADESAEVAS